MDKAPQGPEAFQLDLKLNFPHIYDLFRHHGESFLDDQKLRFEGAVDFEKRKTAFRVGVVGTRKPSHYGISVVRALMSELRFQKEWIWVSGGAFGIDYEVHSAALEFGLQTQAWLVGPIESPSPRSHSELFRQMKNSKGCGLLVPEELNPQMGHRIQPSSWLRRNCWLAADVDALVVVEAHEKSGTWHTARQAIDFSKETYVVPGPILNESSSGTNTMILNGYGQPVVSLTHLTKSLVVLSQRRSYN